jgi:hypothetical protein
MEAIYALCPLEPIIPHGLWAIKALGASCAVTILYEEENCRGGVRSEVSDTAVEKG